jgi:hypothetical protein
MTLKGIKLCIITTVLFMIYGPYFVTAPDWSVDNYIDAIEKIYG